MRCAPLLSRAVPVRDQAGLGSHERQGNVAGAFRAGKGAARFRRHDGAPPKAQLLVVDDVCTSGATVVECVRALRAEGLDVLGAATVALR